MTAATLLASDLETLTFAQEVGVLGGVFGILFVVVGLAAIGWHRLRHQEPDAPAALTGDELMRIANAVDEPRRAGDPGE